MRQASRSCSWAGAVCFAPHLSRPGASAHIPEADTAAKPGFGRVWWLVLGLLPGLRKAEAAVRAVPQPFDCDTGR